MPGFADRSIRADAVGRAVRMIGEGIVDCERPGPGRLGRSTGSPERGTGRLRPWCSYAARHPEPADPDLGSTDPRGRRSRHASRSQLRIFPRADADDLLG